MEGTSPKDFVTRAEAVTGPTKASFDQYTPMCIALSSPSKGTPRQGDSCMCLVAASQQSNTLLTTPYEKSKYDVVCIGAAHHTLLFLCSVVGSLFDG